MRLYLVQHGEAKNKEEDPERSLTKQGETDVRFVAEHLAKNGVKVKAIYHSGKLRAKQTAEIMAKLLNPESVEVLEGLKPLDDPKEVRGAVEDGIMLVGHLPHLSKLTSLLILGDPEREVVKFKVGTVLCLEKEEGWRVRWMLPPELSYPSS